MKKTTPFPKKDDLKHLIGKKVVKRSKRPFKSTFQTNTVKDVVEHEKLPGVPAFTFEEDDSIVAFYICEPTENQNP